MLKHFYLYFCCVPTIIFAQDGDDPGFGDEGGGDAARCSSRPINDLTYPFTYYRSSGKYLFHTKETRNSILSKKLSLLHY